MTIYDTIREKRVEARKKGLVFESGVLGVLIGEIERKTPKLVDGKKTFDDVLVIGVVKSFIANLKELELKGKAVKDEVALLEEFIPQMMSESEIFALAKDHATFPDFMKWLKANRAGRYDGRIASVIAKEHYEALAQ